MEMFHIFKYMTTQRKTIDMQMYDLATNPRSWDGSFYLS